MQISELEEFEGLTEKMVREGLYAHGFAAMPEVGHPLSERWCHEDDWFVQFSGADSEWMQRTVSWASDYLGVSIQSLLREMNPRMRNGWPSEAAREEHGGRWIASRREEYTHTTVVRFLRGITAVKLQYEDHRTTYDPTHEIEKWSFWPCDAHGNKVPWPKGE